MRPPDPPGQATTASGNAGFSVLGAFVALPVCVVLSLCGGFFLSLLSEQPGMCVHGLVPGIVTVVLAGLLVWFAWHMLVRNRSAGRGASFLRGFSLILAVFLLAPWPCSWTWNGFALAAYCGH